MNVQGKVTGLVLLIVGIILIFNILSGTAGDLTNAAGNVSASGLPLANLFGANGVILLIFMAGILISIVAVALKKHKG